MLNQAAYLCCAVCYRQGIPVNVTGNGKEPAAFYFTYKGAALLFYRSVYFQVYTTLLRVIVAGAFQGCGLSDNMQACTAYAVFCVAAYMPGNFGRCFVRLAIRYAVVYIYATVATITQFKTYTGILAAFGCPSCRFIVYPGARVVSFGTVAGYRVIGHLSQVVRVGLSRPGFQSVAYPLL